MNTNPIQLDTSKISTLHLGAILNEVYCPTTKEELEEIYSSINTKNPVVIGGLSNTLVLEDTGSPFILTKNLKGNTVSNNYLYASGGESLTNVCKLALENELGNLECLSGIPGTIGGAIKNNSGCYGSCISDYLDRVFVFNWDYGVVEELTKDELDFSYRYSNIRQDKDIILGAVFILDPCEKEKIANKMKETTLKRRMSQPSGKSLGSVFKKYKDMSAGYYIEQAGLKGYFHNGMEISSVHANFIVNNGGTAKDYLYLLNLAKTKVYEKFGIKLEEEVRIIGLQQSIQNSE